ncbi:hypothetical protein J4461_03140 [Candidatus Pacearchaeota archaeon]|nr:hypothetical protein [Candidatus Pacearchaeota archaeon]
MAILPKNFLKKAHEFITHAFFYLVHRKSIVNEWESYPRRDSLFLEQQCIRHTDAINVLEAAADYNTYNIEALADYAWETSDCTHRNIVTDCDKVNTLIHGNIHRYRNTVPDELLKKYFRVRRDFEELVHRMYNENKI